MSNKYLDILSEKITINKNKLSINTSQLGLKKNTVYNMNIPSGTLIDKNNNPFQVNTDYLFKTNDYANLIFEFTTEEILACTTAVEYDQLWRDKFNEYEVESNILLGNFSRTNDGVAVQYGSLNDNMPQNFIVIKDFLPIKEIEIDVYHPNPNLGYQSDFIIGTQIIPNSTIDAYFYIYDHNPEGRPMFIDFKNKVSFATYNGTSFNHDTNVDWSFKYKFKLNCIPNGFCDLCIFASNKYNNATSAPFYISYLKITCDETYNK